MNIYRITVREIAHLEYEIQAESEEEARDMISESEYPPADIIGWEIVNVVERGS